MLFPSFFFKAASLCAWLWCFTCCCLPGDKGRAAPPPAPWGSGPPRHCGDLGSPMAPPPPPPCRTSPAAVDVPRHAALLTEGRQGLGVFLGLGEGRGGGRNRVVRGCAIQSHHQIGYRKITGALRHACLPRCTSVRTYCSWASVALPAGTPSSVTVSCVSLLPSKCVGDISTTRKRPMSPPLRLRNTRTSLL